MRGPITDGYKALASLALGFVLPWVLVIVAGVGLVSLGYCAKPTVRNPLIVALRDTLRITDSVIVVRAETVTVRQKVVTHWDSVVRTITDTQVVIISDSGDSVVRDTVTIPSEVIAKDRAKDALIASLYGKDSTWEWRYATARKVYQAEVSKANAPRWGVGLSLGYGCVMPKGCGPSLTVGLTWQAKVPNILKLLH